MSETVTIAVNGTTDTVEVGIAGPQGPPGASQVGALIATNNLNDVGNTATALANLGGVNAASVAASVAVETARAQAVEAANVASILQLSYNVKSATFGAKGNTNSVTNAGISSGFPTLTSATASFTSADVGKTVRVNGAGAAGAVLSTTISAFVNSTTVTLAINASTTVTNAQMAYGTDDTAAIQAAINTAGPVGGIVFLPVGNYMISNTLLWQPAPNGITNQAFSAPSIMGVGQGATSPRFLSYTQGSTQLTASGSFPLGQFMIDLIGDTGANNCIAGYEISGMALQCNSLAAGTRNCNGHSSIHRKLTINNAATPAPSNNVGAPAGAMNAVASPTTNAWNNVYEDIMVFSPAQDAFYLFEGTGSYQMASNCVAGNAGRYGFNAGDGSVLLGCSSQGAASADFQVWYSTLIGCNNEPWIGGACAGNALLFTGNNNRQATIIGGTFNGNSKVSVTGESAALINFGAGGEGFDVIMTGVSFKTGSHTSYWAYVPGTATTGKIQLTGCSFNTAGGALATGLYNIVAAISTTFQFRIKDCPGLNPFGTQVIAVPLTTVPTAALPFDATFYVTAGAGGSCSLVISGGPTITVPASACVPVRVPAGQTLTPTYTSAPTWVVEGE